MCVFWDAIPCTIAVSNADRLRTAMCCSRNARTCLCPCARTDRVREHTGECMAAGIRAEQYPLSITASCDSTLLMSFWLSEWQSPPFSGIFHRAGSSSYRQVPCVPSRSRIDHALDLDCTEPWCTCQSSCWLASALCRGRWAHAPQGICGISWAAASPSVYTCQIIFLHYFAQSFYIPVDRFLHHLLMHFVYSDDCDRSNNDIIGEDQLVTKHGCNRSTELSIFSLLLQAVDLTEVRISIFPTRFPNDLEQSWAWLLRDQVSADLAAYLYILPAMTMRNSDNRALPASADCQLCLGCLWADFLRS